jgi:hypothetical protein
VIGNGTFSHCRSLGKKGSFLIMLRHRGFLYGLALVALTGFLASPANAGSINLSVDLGGVVVDTVTSSSPDQFVQFSASDITTVNNDLASAGSAYRIVSLSATSSYGTGDNPGFLQINGQVRIAGTGTTASNLSLDATQSGFTSPIGSNGTLGATSVANQSPLASGTTSYTGDYSPPSTTTTPIVFTGTGYNDSGSATGVPITTVPSGFTLSSHYTLALADIPTTTEGVTGKTTITVAGTVPEPGSVVMLLTGVPLPLVFMGLLRRRKVKAA